MTRARWLLSCVFKQHRLCHHISITTTHPFNRSANILRKNRNERKYPLTQSRDLIKTLDALTHPSQQKPCGKKVMREKECHPNDNPSYFVAGIPRVQLYVVCVVVDVRPL